jgi:hypothetical protein
MSSPKKFVLFIALTMCGSGSAQAAGIIWDFSPLAAGVLVGPDWFVQDVFSSLADRVIFSQSTVVTGIDIYMGQEASVGQIGLITLWSDDTGRPGPVLSHFTDRVTAVDTDGAGPANRRVHVDFTSPLYLNAQTPYWINMTSTLGTRPQWTQSVRRNIPGGDNKNAGMVNEVQFDMVYSNGDLAFRLYGNPVPEPSTFMLIGLGVSSGYVLIRRTVLEKAGRKTALSREVR